MKKFMDLIMGAMRQFTPVDYAIFKIAMFASGIFVGLWFFFTLENYVGIILGIAICSILYICYKLIRYMCKQR